MIFCPQIIKIKRLNLQKFDVPFVKIYHITFSAFNSDTKILLLSINSKSQKRISLTLRMTKTIIFVQVLKKPRAHKKNYFPCAIKNTDFVNFFICLLILDSVV